MAEYSIQERIQGLNGAKLSIVRHLETSKLYTLCSFDALSEAHLNFIHCDINLIQSQGIENIIQCVDLFKEEGKLHIINEYLLDELFGAGSCLNRR